VLDLTRLLPGALATQILCDFGATVTKIEQPGRGDPARHFPSSPSGEFFASVNEGKKSVAINIRKPSGREALLRLTRSADVLVEGFRHGVMDRLGLGYGVIRHHNPKLIYVSINGYGSKGSDVQKPGHDLNYCAVAGILRPQPWCTPSVPLVQLADILGGLHAATGVLLALIARSKTGLGQRVEISLFHAAFWALPVVRATTWNGFLAGSYACYNVYRTQDDLWIAVGALEVKFWTTLCNKIGRPDFISQQFAAEFQQGIIRYLT